MIKKANLADRKMNNLIYDFELSSDNKKQNEIEDEIKELNNAKNKIEDKIKKLNNEKNKIENEIKKRELLLNKKNNDFSSPLFPFSNEEIKEKGNKGEKGEVVAIKKIYNLSKINDIKSLKLIFGDNADNGIIMYNIKTNEKIEKISDIKKAKNRSKSDFIIKFIKNNIYVNCSIKCYHGSMPSILNHTPRSAKVFQDGGDLFSELKNLDTLICYLNKERTDGNVGEDIHIKKMNMSEESKKCIIHFFI
jgi:hypothetical protein